MLILRDGTELIDTDGDYLCHWDDRRPAQDMLERKREDMRECRKLAKRKGGSSGYERIRGYRLACLRTVEVEIKKTKGARRKWTQKNC